MKCRLTAMSSQRCPQAPGYISLAIAFQKSGTKSLHAASSVVLTQIPAATNSASALGNEAIERVCKK